MEINYLLIAIIILVVLALVIFLIKRNQKDKRNFEKNLNQSEIKPEEHKDPEPL